MVYTTQRNAMSSSLSSSLLSFASTSLSMWEALCHGANAHDNDALAKLPPGIQEKRLFDFHLLPIIALSRYRTMDASHLKSTRRCGTASAIEWCIHCARSSICILQARHANHHKLKLEENHTRNKTVRCIAHAVWKKRLQ